MLAIAGLLLLALTCYVSTLADSLHHYSRARLAELLPESQGEAWLAWLDKYDYQLHTTAKLVRLLLNIAVLPVVLAWTAQGQTRYSAGALVDAVLLTAVLLGFFSIAIPHAIAVHAADTVVASSRGALAIMRLAFWPLQRICDLVEFIIRRLLGKAEETTEAETERVEQEILDAVEEGEAAGAVDEEKREMIQSVFEFDETTVSAIMTPRTDIDAVPVTATFEEVRQMILRTGHSRIPVYEGSVDHIVGVVYAKDLLRLNPGEPFDVREVMRRAPFVPETKTLDELLEEFRATKVQIAIVLDEYGGTAGLATIEDVLEELVGEIDDEYDQRPPPAINRIDENTLDVDARVHISEINAELDTGLPEEADYETIGGFVFATLGKIPAVGEELQHDNIRIRITDSEARRIRRLQIQVQPTEARSA